MACTGKVITPWNQWLPIPCPLIWPTKTGREEMNGFFGVSWRTANPEILQIESINVLTKIWIKWFLNPKNPERKCSRLRAHKMPPKIFLFVYCRPRQQLFTTFPLLFSPRRHFTPKRAHRPRNTKTDRGHSQSRVTGLGKAKAKAGKALKVTAANAAQGQLAPLIPGVSPVSLVFCFGFHLLCWPIHRPLPLPISAKP